VIGLGRASGVAQPFDGRTATATPGPVEPPNAGATRRHFQRSFFRKSWCPLTSTHARDADVNEDTPPDPIPTS
jgi:hypothetical protein